MAESLIVRAVLQLQTEFRAIQRSLGFNFDVHGDAVSIDANDRIRTLTGDTGLSPYIVIETPGYDATYSGGGQTRKAVDLLVAVAADTEPLDPMATVSTWGKVVADIERACAREPTLGGVVTDVRVLNARMGVMMGERRVFGLIDLQLLIHHTYGRPNG